MLGILGGDERCPIARALDVLGEKWTLMVVRDALTGCTRFSDFQSSLGIPRDVLADRLDTLVDAGVLVRQPYKPATGRTREEYVLTPAGNELSLVLLALGDWAHRHRTSPLVPSIQFLDPDTGQHVRPAAVTSGERIIPTGQLEVHRGN